ENTRRDLHSSLSQPRKSASANRRIGVRHAGHHSPDSGGNHRVRTRPGAALMRARLKVDVERGAVRLLSGLLDCQNLGMFHAFIGMEPLTNDIAAGIY